MNVNESHLRALLDELAQSHEVDRPTRSFDADSATRHARGPHRVRRHAVIVAAAVIVTAGISTVVLVDRDDDTLVSTDATTVPTPFTTFSEPEPSTTAPPDTTVVVTVTTAGTSTTGAPVSTEVPDTTASTLPTSPPPTALPSLTTGPPVVTLPPSSSTVDIPTGTLMVDDLDLFVVHDDGDLYLYDGALGGGGEQRLVADLEDPRPEQPEGQTNTVDGVAGVVNGSVLYTECCEPISGTLLAAPGGEVAPARVATGYSPVLSPDGTRLATSNSQALTIIDVGSREVTYRPLAPTSDDFLNVWDMVWSADGTKLVVLYFDSRGFGLTWFSTTAPFDQGPATPIGVPFDPDTAGSVRLAGRGLDGTIAVTTPDEQNTAIRYFEPVAFGEQPFLERRLPPTVQSVRVADDGQSLLWIDRGRLWYLPVRGDSVDLGTGFTSAWFAHSSSV